jgi:hypothetical protein
MTFWPTVSKDDLDESGGPGPTDRAHWGRSSRNSLRPTSGSALGQLATRRSTRAVQMAHNASFARFVTPRLTAWWAGTLQRL